MIVSDVLGSNRFKNGGGFENGRGKSWVGNVQLRKLGRGMPVGGRIACEHDFDSLLPCISFVIEMMRVILLCRNACTILYSSKFW